LHSQAERSTAKPQALARFLGNRSIFEQGPTAQVLFAPQAQYTLDLLAAIPHPTFA